LAVLAEILNRDQVDRIVKETICIGYCNPVKPGHRKFVTLNKENDSEDIDCFFGYFPAAMQQ
jgi:hypothetical protein